MALAIYFGFFHIVSYIIYLRPMRVICTYLVLKRFMIYLRVLQTFTALGLFASLQGTK